MYIHIKAESKSGIVILDGGLNSWLGEEDVLVGSDVVRRICVDKKLNMYGRQVKMIMHNTNMICITGTKNYAKHTFFGTRGNSTIDHLFTNKNYYHKIINMENNNLYREILNTDHNYVSITVKIENNCEKNKNKISKKM